MSAEAWASQAPLRSALTCEIMLSNSDNMIRTQISFDEQEYRAAKQQAKALGISLAELVRRAIRLMLPADKSKPWMRYAGSVESGDLHSSQHIDEWEYGRKE